MKKIIMLALYIPLMKWPCMCWLVLYQWCILRYISHFKFSIILRHVGTYLWPQHGEGWGRGLLVWDYQGLIIKQIQIPCLTYNKHKSHPVMICNGLFIFYWYVSILRPRPHEENYMPCSIQCTHLLQKIRTWEMHITRF